LSVISSQRRKTAVVKKEREPVGKLVEEPMGRGRLRPGERRNMPRIIFLSSGREERVT